MLSQHRPPQAHSDADPVTEAEATSLGSPEQWELQGSMLHEDEDLISGYQPGGAVDSHSRQRGLGGWLHLNLRRKVTIVATALGALPVLTVGILAYSLADGAITQQVARTKEAETVQLADKLTRFMIERLANIKTLSRLPNLVLTEQELVLSEAAQASLQDQFTQFVRDYLVFDSVALLDRQGQVILQSQGAVPDTDPSDQSYFRQVLESGQPTISEPLPYQADVDNPLAIYVAAPVNNPQGQVIGVVSARMPVDFVGNAVLRTGGLNPQSTYRLVDSRGQIFQNFQDPSGLPVGTPASESLVLFPQINELSVTQSWIDPSGQTLNAYTPMGPVADLDWSVTTSTDMAIAFAAQDQLLITTLVGTVLTAILIAILGAYLARRATQPVIAAARTVRQIGQGNLSARTQIGGRDELSILGSNINRMADQIQDLLRSLQEGAERLRRQTEVLSQLARDEALVQGDLTTTAQRFAQAIVQTLQLNQVAVWIYPEEGKPECIDRYREGEGSSEGGDRSTRPWEQQILAEVKHYGQPRILNGEEGGQHHSLLAMPIQLANQVVGALYCEQFGNRAWTLEEQSFVGSVANLVSLCLEAMERSKAQEQLRAREQQQRQEKEALQQRAMQLLMEVDPVSKGDLTVRARVTSDEIGTVADSYNAIISNLSDIVVQVKRASQAVSQTAQRNQEPVNTLSTEAIQQAQALTQVIQQLQALLDSSRQVAARADQAEIQMQQAHQTVQLGDEAMNRTVSGFQAIRETVADTTKKVKRLGETSQKISKVVSLINTFAAQTNLLSLNAAIEAARAGEQGRGFAVVAEEVRSLAQQSSAATTEIEQLVEAIQRETNEVVAAMEAGTDQVVVGTQVVEETRQQLSQITQVSQQISTLVEEIVTASTSQAQISTAVGQTLDQVTQIAKRTSEHSISVAQSFQDLLQVAQALEISVAQFRLSQAYSDQINPDPLEA